MPSRVVTWLLAALGLVALALCAASVGTIWRTGSMLVQRERSQAMAAEALVEAAIALEKAAAPAWGFIPSWPETLSSLEWEVIDEFLAEQSEKALADYPRVESGFFLPEHSLYLGRASKAAGSGRSGEQEPPAAVRETVGTQIRLAVDRGQPQMTISGPNAEPVAVRAAPIKDETGQVIAVLWTITRFEGPLFHDLEAAKGYRLAASMALVGIGLALALALALGWAARRHTLERSRLRAELRRSERLAALGKLLAGVAHEVRNPLAGIRSSVQLWQRGLGPDPASMESVVAEVDRIDGLVGQLLRFSRTQTSELVPADLNELVMQAAQLARPQAEACGIRVELDLSERLSPVDLDRPAFLQVLRNLTGNAIQAMPDGGRLRLSTRQPLGSRSVEVRVADTGPGLSEETRAHLFEPFFTTRPDGTGLGLAIAREIVLAHRGDIWAGDAPGSATNHASDSDRPLTKPGPGAVFVIRLPISRSSEGKEPTQPPGACRPVTTA